MNNLPVLLLIGLTLTFVILGCKDANRTSGSGNSSSTSSSTDSKKSTPSEVKAQVSMETFKKLSNGMSKMDVVKILGRRGELVSENRFGDITTEMYMWEGDVGDFGSNMNIMFQNDELVSKSQFGLK